MPVLQRLGEDAESLRASAREAIEKLPALSGNTVPDIRPSKEFVWVLQQAEKEATGLSRRVHLHRAHPAGAGRQEVRRRRPASRPRGAAERDLRGPRARTASPPPPPRTATARWRSTAATSPPRPRAASSTR